MRSNDVEIELYCAGLFGILKASSAVSGGGYYSVSSFEDGGDEVSADFGGTACYEPGELRHCGCEGGGEWVGGREGWCEGMNVVRGG